jgi:hypothetical protein
MARAALVKRQAGTLGMAEIAVQELALLPLPLQPVDQSQRRLQRTQALAGGVEAGAQLFQARRLFQTRQRGVRLQRCGLHSAGSLQIEGCCRQGLRRTGREQQQSENDNQHSRRGRAHDSGVTRSGEGSGRAAIQQQHGPSPIRRRSAKLLS